MKKNIFYTVLVAFFTPFSLVANHSTSDLNIDVDDQHSTLLVFLDQRQVGAKSDHFHLEHLQAGNHQLKVIKFTQSGSYHHPYTTSLVVYNRIINLAPGTVTSARVDHHNRFITTSCALQNANNVVTSNTYYQTGYSGYNSGGYYGYNAGTNYGNNSSTHTNYGNYSGGGNTYGNSCSNGTVGYVQSNYNSPAPAYSYAMSNANFNNVKYAINNTSFDSSKLGIAQQAVAANYMTSAQISELMNMLTFESSKLKLAKYSYAYAVDPENYYIVNNAFTFSSSINELDDFLALY